LNVHRIFAWKNQSVGIFDPVKKVYRRPMNKYHMIGVSDILGVYDGKFLAIEVKTQSGVVSNEQRSFINQINREGGIAFVARSLDDVVTHLKVTE
jgi:hypothetical protein